MYYYCATSQKSTSIWHSIVCSFTGPNDRNFVLAKGNHLEVHLLCEDSIVPIVDAPLFGKISTIDCYRHQGENVDSLFLLLESKHFFVLKWDPVNKKLVAKATGNVRDRVGRDFESGHISLIDPQYRLIAMILSEGMIKILPIEGLAFKEAYNVRLDVNRFLDIKFLHGCAKPTLCMLYEDPRRYRHIRTFVVDLREKELIQGPWSQSNVEHGANTIIAVPSPTNGIIIIGETTITYLNGQGNVQSTAINPTKMGAWGVIDNDGTRFLLGDLHGTLYVLLLVKSENVVVSIVVEYVGVSSIAQSINYLDNGVVYIGSAFGDSQLIKLRAAPDENGSFIDVLESYPNIGPITDMCVVKTEKQGQSQIVTCSGAFKDGSLRIIRSGIGLYVQAAMEIHGIKGMWSLRKSEDDVYDKYLVQSFIGETRILAIENEEMGEVEIAGFKSQQQTLFCSNVIGKMILQVTPDCVGLIDIDTMQLVHQFIPPSVITVATSNLEQVVIAVAGKLIYLEIDLQSRTLKQVGEANLNHDIACMSLRPLEEILDMNIDEPDGIKLVKGSSSIVALGMWTDNTIRFLSLPECQEVLNISLGIKTQARDILLVSLGGAHYVLIGLGDGTLINYALDFSCGLPTLSSQRKVVLGTHPISFTCFSNSGQYFVFATCDRPTVIYGKNGKLFYSVVNTQEVTSMTPFHSELFPESLSLATENGLVIGYVNEIQKIQITSIPLGEAPRRICHSEEMSTYCVLSQKSVLNEGCHESFSRVLFLDNSSFSIFSTFELDHFEDGISLMTCTFEGIPGEFFVVGTAYVKPEEIEPSKGRLLVFKIENRTVTLVAEKEVKGAIFTLAPLRGKIVAGIGCKVQVYKFNPTGADSTSIDRQTPSLEHECGHHGHVLVLCLKTIGDFVLVGDLYRSLSVLKYKSTDGALEEVARDFTSNQMRAIEVMDGYECFLGAEEFGNIFVVKRQLDATLEEEKTKMISQGEFHLGDYVNVFRHGMLNSQPTDVDKSSSAGNSVNIKGSIMYGTMSGAIGALLELDEESFNFFASLETAMKRAFPGVIGMNHQDWRDFNNGRRQVAQKNIIDGDLVERIMDLEKIELDKVIVDTNTTYNSRFSMNDTTKAFTLEDILRRVEDIARCH